MLSQFSPMEGKETLSQLGPFENDVYPVGRLDSDSEGLLILTNDKSLNSRLLDPKHGHKRSYLVQVDGQIDEDAALKLRKGITITVDGKSHKTLPSEVKILRSEPDLPARIPPIRYRKNIPVSWIELVLTEGKNRQVRKMTAAVGFPTLRLVRISIEKIALGKMQPGEVIELQKEELFKKLFG